MSKMAKFGMAIGLILGLLGAGIGIYAAINPMGVMQLMQDVNIFAIMPYMALIIPAFVTIILIFAFMPMIKGMGRNSKLQKKLQETGQRATVKVLSVRDTGMTVNLAPYVDVTVEMPGGGSATIRTLVSRVAFPRVGDMVEVIYDPANPQDAIFA